MSGKVLIRADGSKTIGMGHIHRSSLLADMFKKKFNLNSVLLMRKDSAALEYATKRGLLFQEVPVLQPQEDGKWIKEYAVQNNIVLCV